VTRRRQKRTRTLCAEPRVGALDQCIDSTCNAYHRFISRVTYLVLVILLRCRFASRILDVLVVVFKLFCKLALPVEYNGFI
jgi:hypothetical protein